MNYDDIMAALMKDTGPLPRKALEEAARQREGITPYLLGVLEDAVEWGRAKDNPKDDIGTLGTTFALYLLAQFRETRAYPLVASLARLPEKTLYAIIGDVMTEDLDRILASVCGGDTSLIETIIEDAEAGEYGRACAISALKILVATGAKTRDEVIAYYKLLFNGRLERTPSAAWCDLVSCATRLHPEELYEDIVDAFEEELVEDFFMDLEDVDNVRRMSQEKVMGRLSTATLGYIEDTAREMRRWACFQQPSQTIPINDPPIQNEFDYEPSSPLPAPKIGPNDPCHCGSGRKHKKCCGRMA